MGRFFFYQVRIVAFRGERGSYNAGLLQGVEVEDCSLPG